MKKTSSLPLLKDGYGESEDLDEQENESFLMINGGTRNDEIGEVTDPIGCITLHSRKRDSSKHGEDFSPEKYALWRQQQKTRAARLEKQLKAKWALEELIEEQLNRFNTQYNQAMHLTRLKDVSHFLMPKWASPLEMAAFGWMGDWRPSSILDLLRSLVRSSSLSLSCSSSDQIGMDRTLTQLIRDIRIEEAVIDEEMGEIQSNCVLHLPFGSRKGSGSGSDMERAQSEFKKIERVIIKAQRLRFKALELIVKKVLNQSDAAEFLVTFAGIQESIHQFGAQHRMQKGLVSIPTSAAALEMEGGEWEPRMLGRFSLFSGDNKVSSSRVRCSGLA